jgi:hypothetical protein
VGLQHAAVALHDAAGDGQMDRAAAGVRPAHLDPHHVATPCRRDHDRRVAATRHDRRPPGRVHARHVRDQMGQRLREPARVDHRLDRRRVHGVLGAARTDQLDRALDARRDDLVEPGRLLVQLLLAGVQPLEGEDVVDQRGHPGVPGGQMVQGLVGLRPQLTRRIGREAGQLAAQLRQR